MSENPQSEQPAAGVFVTTRWSMIAGAKERDTAESEAALEKMCTFYWRPV